MRVTDQLVHRLPDRDVSLMLNLHLKSDQLALDTVEVTLMLQIQLIDCLLFVILSEVHQAHLPQYSLLCMILDYRSLLDTPVNEILGSLLLAVMEVSLQGMLSHFICESHHFLEPLLPCLLFFLTLRWLLKILYHRVLLIVPHLPQYAHAHLIHTEDFPATTLHLAQFRDSCDSHVPQVVYTLSSRKEDENLPGSRQLEIVLSDQGEESH